MPVLLPLAALVAPAHALDIAVTHGATTLTYQLEVGESVDETWEGMLNPTARPRKQEDLRVVLRTEQREDQIQVEIRLEAVGRKGARLIANPTLFARPGQRAEYLSGGELPVTVRDQRGEVVQVRFVEYGTQVLLGPDGSLGTNRWTALAR